MKKKVANEIIAKSGELAYTCRYVIPSSVMAID